MPVPIRRTVKLAPSADSALAGAAAAAAAADGGISTDVIRSASTVIRQFGVTSFVHHGHACQIVSIFGLFARCHGNLRDSADGVSVRGIVSVGSACRR